MSLVGASRNGAVSPRRCGGCGTTLAVDNSAPLCGRCQRDRRDQFESPPTLSREFFDTKEFDAAFRANHMGKVIKAYRNHPRHLEIYGKALNQETIGRWLGGLTQGAVSKIENGQPEQSLKVLRQQAEILRIPVALLWFTMPGGSLELEIIEYDEDKPVSRSEQPDWIESSYEFAVNGYRVSADVEFVRLAAQESANYGLRHPVAELHFTTLEQIEEEVQKLSFDFIANDPLDTFNRSRQLRNDIFILLEGKYPPWQEQQLYAFGARTLGYLAGASSDFYGLYDAAADHLRLARRFADTSGFPEIRSWVLSLQSGNSFWMAEWTKAATFAERALKLAVTKSGFLRATSMRARALARLGDQEGLRLAIGQSEANPVSGKMDEERGMILFSESNYLRCIGSAYLWVGEYAQANERLTEALQRYVTETPENFAVIATIRADIATAYLHQKDIRAAANAVEPLLELSSNYRLEGAIRRLREIESQIKSHKLENSPPAVELLNNISTFIDHSAPKPQIEEN